MRSSSGAPGRPVSADQLGEIDIHGTALASDLVHQARALDLIEAQTASESLDRAAVLGHAASARVVRQRGVDLRGNVAKMQCRHDPER